MDRTSQKSFCPGHGKTHRSASRIRPRIAVAILASAAFVLAIDLTEQFFNAPNTVLFMGDSITENGLYANHLFALLKKKYPDIKANFIGSALIGETVSGLTINGDVGSPCLFDRIDESLTLKPSLVFACYGMNDGVFAPFSEARFTAYKNGILKLIQKVRAAGADLILLTPPPFDSLGVIRGIDAGRLLPAGLDTSKYGFKAYYVNYDSVLSAYGQWLQTNASDHVLVVDVHRPMREFLAAQRLTDPHYILNPDGLHPDSVAYLVMAQAIYKGLFPGAHVLPGERRMALGMKRVDGAMEGSVVNALGRLVENGRGTADRAPCVIYRTTSTPHGNAEPGRMQ